MEHSEKKMRAAKLSMTTALVLAVSKFAVGLFSGSLAVLSSAIDSMLDILMSLLNLLAIRQADQPADENHAYGHGKFETMAALIQALIIGGSGVWIFFESIRRLLAGATPSRLGSGMVILLASVAASWLIGRYLSRVGRETDSSALRADALHFSMDVYTNLALLAGMVLMYFLHWLWIDAVLSMVVAAYIFAEAFKLIRLSLREVLDEQLPAAQRQQIQEIVHHYGGDTFCFHNLRTRKAGSHKLIDFHITVCKHLSVAESHQLTEELEQEIRGVIHGADIMIHVEPCGEEDCRYRSQCKAAGLRPRPMGGKSEIDFSCRV
ncbi:cation diffusion facilitator family transporter [Desulfogranum mediterraneum]|uniref:cation diffusion facilitator family transporter n=1 Tax=Desulfogranum mediterraneum TaxID=160661 RepID=UPI00041A5C1B|nr:cation diffusion facilitator family transporter [Desulfogranum mediterraneum]